MTCDLASKSCVPCRGGVPPLQGEALAALYRQLGSDWELVDEHHLIKRYRFPNFVEALAFTNQVGELAEEQNHHPDIELGWGKVVVKIWTHKINGLTESDFIFAAKTDLRLAMN
jgi:4a-hydroxytetrahydrobiopterin dehydratase